MNVNLILFKIFYVYSSLLSTQVVPAECEMRPKSALRLVAEMPRSLRRYPGSILGSISTGF